MRHKNGFKSTLSHLEIASRFFLTLPVTNYSAERPSPGACSGLIAQIDK